MSERKTRGRQRIPIKLIANKDDLLVSFSKRRVGVYKKASELSTLCGVDVGAIIFSPSGIPHSFFTPDFDSVVHGRQNAAQQRDGNGNPRTRIRELNKRLDEVVEQQQREEEREKQLGAAAETGWWEVPVESLNAEQVKAQIEWFQALRAQIKSRAQELKNSCASSPAVEDGAGELGDHVSGDCFFAPPASLDDVYTGHAGIQNLFPPPPPQLDAGGGSADRYLFAPPPFDARGSGQYCYPPPSLNLFGGGGIGNVSEQYIQPPSPLRGGISHCLGDGYGYLPREAHGYGEAGPSRPNQN